MGADAELKGECMMPRKIIQILFDAEGYLHALCDDGTIWVHELEDNSWLNISTYGVDRTHKGTFNVE
jgi:hypothetical protein